MPMMILVIAPHPDDETLGCGGTLASHASKGDRVVVAFLTSGELGIKSASPEQVWAVREKEASEAARVLSVASISFLRCPDWFLGDNIDAAGAALRPLLQREQPDLIYVPHTLEWHPDHKAAQPVLAAALDGLDF